LGKCRIVFCMLVVDLRQKKLEGLRELEWGSVGYWSSCKPRYRWYAYRHEGCEDRWIWRTLFFTQHWACIHPEVPIVLKEFHRVLDDDGFVVITCPELQSVGAQLATGCLIEPLYESDTGSISALEIIYGHRGFIAAGNYYMAHICLVLLFQCYQGFLAKLDLYKHMEQQYLKFMLFGWLLLRNLNQTKSWRNG